MRWWSRVGRGWSGRSGGVAPVGVRVCRMGVLRLLMALPTPTPAMPTVLSLDGFALRRGHRWSALLIDAVIPRRIDVLADRTAATLADWLREDAGVQVVPGRLGRLMRSGRAPRTRCRSVTGGTCRTISPRRCRRP
jgi:hypothetical protein